VRVLQETSIETHTSERWCRGGGGGGGGGDSGGGGGGGGGGSSVYACTLVRARAFTTFVKN
jgi:hypothetical protein